MIAATHLRDWIFLIALSAVLVVSQSASASAGEEVTATAIERHCVQEALAPPVILDASMTHPGDFKSQVAYAEFRFEDLPADCQARFKLARPRFQFQLQDHLHRSRWINLGPFRPSGLSQRRNTHPFWAHWGGSHGSANPIPQHLLYQCSPGPPVTRVRLLLKGSVVNLETQDEVIGKTFTVPVKVRRVRAPLKHHGAVRGPC
jgi:hypothetical protein